MNRMRANREIVKSVALGAGAISLVGGLAIGAVAALEKMQEQVVQGLQQATYPGGHSAMIGPAAPIKQENNDVGPTPKDYVVPGSIALTEVGIGGYILWRFREKKQPQHVEPQAVSTFILSPQEEQAFQMIVSRFDQDD